jgi:hypothetical protein
MKEGTALVVPFFWGSPKEFITKSFTLRKGSASVERKHPL